MIKFPKENADLQRLVFRRMVLPLGIGAVVTALWLAAECYTFIRFIDNPRGILFSSILYFLVWLAPIFALKIPDRLKERSYEGEIVDIHISDRIVSQFWFAGTIGTAGRHFKTVADLTIKDAKGRTRTYAYILHGKLPVKVGSRVRRYAATDYLFLLDEDAPIVCVNCGTHWNEKEADKQAREDAEYWGYSVEPSQHIPERCTFCRKTLIKRPPPKHRDY